jgi:HEAT repeat protein
MKHSTVRLAAGALLAALVTGCGGHVRHMVWPPAEDPTLDGLYPYAFEQRGLAGVESLHTRLMSTQIEDRQRESQLLFALGKAQVDAFIWALSLEPERREEVVRELGEMLGVEDATSEKLLADPGPLLSPLRMLSMRDPKGPMAGAARDAHLALRLLTHEELSDEQMERFLELTSEQTARGGAARGARLIVVGRTLDAVAVAEGPERSRMLVEGLARFADRAAEGEGGAARVERVLSWTVSAVYDAAKDPDPLMVELRDVMERARVELLTVHFPAGLPESAPLPDLRGIEAGADDPFRYVVLDAEGEVRVATALVYGIEETGEVVLLGGESRWAWPGKVVQEPAGIPDALSEAGQTVELLGPVGGSPVWDRGVGLAVEPTLDVTRVTPVIDVLQATLDHVVIVGRGESGTRFVLTDVRPNCAMAGTRLGAVLSEGEVVLQNVTVGGEDEATVSDAGEEDPLLLAGRVHDQSRSILGKPRPDVFLEVSRQDGEWTWGQVVSVYEGMITGVEHEAEEYGVDVQLQTFLLPTVTMAESRELEVLAELGEDMPELPEVEETTREQLVLMGAYGDYDEALLDAWMSAYLQDEPLDEAATVVLDVARCWGGDYRERAVEALGAGNRSVLEHVATYLGDPVIGEVAESILEVAGERSVPVLVWKLRSRDERVWMAAWRVLAEQEPDHIRGALRPLLQDPDAEIRLRALQLYGSSMPAGEYDEILPLLDDPDVLVQRWAMATAGMLQVHDAVDRLLTYAQSKNALPEVRAEALYALGLLEVDEALPLMVEAAGHADAEVRELAALALGSVGVGEEALPALVGLLGDEEPTVVINALHSLVNVGSMDAIPYIEAVLDSEHPGVVAEAEETVERITDMNVVLIDEMGGDEVKEACDSFTPQELLELAHNPSEEAMQCLIDQSLDKEPDMREAACIAMGERRDPSAVHWLKKRTKDKYKDVRIAAWDALEIFKKME